MKTILVTGFEPFGEHKQNPSWTAVRELNGLVFNGVEVVARELAVEYVRVKQQMDEIEAETQFDAILHCGVGLQGIVRLEALARNAPYLRSDNLGAQSPVPGFCCSPTLSSDTRLNTCIDLNAAVQYVCRKTVLPCAVSNDAGLYLCEFTYFNSLCRRRETAIPVLFCHVPPLGNEPFTIENVRSSVSSVIDFITQQCL